MCGGSSEVLLLQILFISDLEEHKDNLYPAMDRFEKNIQKVVKNT